MTLMIVCFYELFFVLNLSNTLGNIGFLFTPFILHQVCFRGIKIRPFRVLKTAFSLLLLASRTIGENECEHYILFPVEHYI